MGKSQYIKEKKEKCLHETEYKQPHRTKIFTTFSVKELLLSESKKEQN